MAGEKLIPGSPLWQSGFLIHSDEYDDAFWSWAACLGVALSMAGALASAYGLGFDECWNYMTGRDGR